MISLLFVAQVQLTLSQHSWIELNAKGVRNRVLCLLPELIIYMNLTLKIFHRKLGLMRVLCNCFAILIDHHK